jgi:hypothetical protein
VGRGLRLSSRKAKSQSLLRKLPSRKFWHLRFYLAPASCRRRHQPRWTAHEDYPQLFLALRMLRLRTIYGAENIGNMLKRVVNVCQPEFVKEVLGRLVTEFICNFGRQNVRSIQNACYGGLFDPRSAVKIVRLSSATLFETLWGSHTFDLTLACSYNSAFMHPHI